MENYKAWKPMFENWTSVVFAKSILYLLSHKHSWSFIVFQAIFNDFFYTHMNIFLKDFLYFLRQFEATNQHNIPEKYFWREYLINLSNFRGCVSMGAVGAMAPTNFQKDAFGTDEISNSMYICNSYLIDCTHENFCQYRMALTFSYS